MLEKIVMSRSTWFIMS